MRKALFLGLNLKKRERRKKEEERKEKKRKGKKRKEKKKKRTSQLETMSMLGNVISAQVDKGIRVKNEIVKLK